MSHHCTYREELVHLLRHCTLQNDIPTHITIIMKYEEALRELETIVEQMESNDLDIDTLSQQLQRAKQLIKLCKERLAHTDKEIQQLLNEEEEEK